MFLPFKVPPVRTSALAFTIPLQHGGLWMTSSKEILLFRRSLLDPVTGLQFQHFVALKGELLENDVLFWLEVQRYKVKWWERGGGPKARKTN